MIEEVARADAERAVDDAADRPERTVAGAIAALGVADETLGLRRGGIATAASRVKAAA